MFLFNKKKSTEEKKKTVLQIVIAIKVALIISFASRTEIPKDWLFLYRR